MILRTYNPIDQLQPYIKRYCLLNELGFLANTKIRTVTDGGSELVINLGSPCTFYNPPRKKSTSLNINICGQFIDHQFVYLTNETYVLSVEFKYGGIFAIFGIPQNEFLSNQIPFSDLEPRAASLLFEEIMSSIDDNSKINVIERFLLFHLSKQKSNKCIIANKLEQMEKLELLPTLQCLAEEYYLTYRTFDRNFSKEIGVSPKQYLEIIKLNRIAKYLKNYEIIDWQEIVYKFNFCDQSHLIHFFKKYTGLTPTEFYSSQRSNLSYLGKITFILPEHAS